MAVPSVAVDFATAQGVPLTKKFVMFDSGLVDVDRYARDAGLFRRCKTSSLRMDLFIGDRSTDLGDLVDGTLERLAYHWTKSDRLVEILKANGVSPYYSWCYVPLPLQPEGGSFRSVPVSWEAYQEVMRAFARHYRERGSPLGFQEVYNEPINPGAFFDGDVDDYNTMYRYGATGLRQGDPDALVGGSAEAFVLPPEQCQQNVRRFLAYVEEHDLPLDFFSYHSYGDRDKVYLERTRLMREALAESHRFDGVDMHMNEFNTVPPPWPYKKTILEQPALLPQILTAMEDLLEETDVTLVHWAQFLESGVDALGLVDRLGRLLPGFYAFELYARMPWQRVATACPEEYGCMASRGANRLSAIIWNKSDRALRMNALLSGIPSEFAFAGVCVVDADFLAGLRDDYQLRPKVRTQVPVIDGAARYEGFVLGVHDVVYIECNTRRLAPRLNPGLSWGRVFHWYPDRTMNSFAELDTESGTAYLGANGNAGATTIVSAEFHLAEADDLQFARERVAGSAELCIRVDYRAEGGYVSAVQLGGAASPFGRGTGRAPDAVAPLSEGVIPIGAHAPEGWNGDGLLTLWGQEATRDHLETISFGTGTADSWRRMLR